MAILQRLSDDELKTLADRVLAPEMEDLGFQGVEVENRDIFDDEPSLHIGARVSGDVPAPFDPDRFDRFRQLLLDALSDRGDGRFPHLVLQREGDERPEPYYVPVDP